jgi:hypothetical protein
MAEVKFDKSWAKLLGGKHGKMRINGHMVDVLLPPKTGPSEKEMMPIFRKMAKVLEKRNFRLFKIPKD